MYFFYIEAFLCDIFYSFYYAFVNDKSCMYEWLCHCHENI